MQDLSYTRENTVSEKEESKKNTINVKSTVGKEKPKSGRSRQKQKTYQASTKHSTKGKPSSNTENKYSNKNSFQTQASVLFERNVETESHCEIEREQIQRCANKLSTVISSNLNEQAK